jgi:hypothetical protein
LVVSYAWRECILSALWPSGAVSRALYLTPLSFLQDYTDITIPGSGTQQTD